MLWEQLLALAGVSLAQRQIPGGWFGLGIFPCRERKVESTTGWSTAVLVAGGQTVCRSEMQADKGFR